MTAAKRILIVEDEPAIADTLIYVLNSSGYQTEHVGLLQTALTRLQSATFSLAILDVGLPDGNGFDLCRQLRRFSDIPVIFLTAHSDEIDRIVGLEIGADDYVTKPFSPREVAARVGVILRRLAAAEINQQTPAANTPFDLDSQAGRIRYYGHLLDLTRYEFLLLKLLIEHPERIFSREQLLERIWQDPGDVFDRTVDTHIKTLRAKLRLAAADQDPIRTHRGLGYSLQSR
ncbi:Response regulator CreB of two-component signal transduction system CreBC [Methylomonas albis]|uniref:Two-component system response regulator CreB n=1 Tax=Methylomonas albis TaxID=1854563 RepID=A0ABR9CXL5_9GAMM|nr:two-component system response regulator CreB [Methylomonas albis]MBD9355465.1 two-component system response regulator CreB [Methylomonas albis]CAD6878451.1 Response regulator CreB of two-component signal transduction system CreBC [Methylomonas albis]